MKSIFLIRVFYIPEGRILPTNQRQKVFQNGTLLITDIMPRTEDGLYTCEVRSHQGVPVSRTFRVTIRSNFFHMKMNKT